MPYDEVGNLSTPKTVNVKTIHDVIVDDKQDILPLKVGGVARIAQDDGEGGGVVITKAAEPAG